MLAFERIKHAIGRFFGAPQRGRTAARMYGMSKQSRLTADWYSSTTSEDSELASSLKIARARSRSLVRDAAYAQRAKQIIQNNVVGSGIGLQAKSLTARGDLNDRVNDGIEAAWKRWTCASSCHTGGALHFSALERMAVGQVFEAGEIFLRLHFERFGDSQVPLAIELVEPERIADEFQPGASEGGAHVRLGIEVDQYHRALAYWFRSLHPGELRLTAEQTSRVERVPSSAVIHLRIVERWPQTRAIPWLHAAARKLNDMDGLTEAEITAARASACYMGFITPANGENGYGTVQADGSREVELSPAVVEQLNPGDTFTPYTPNRPNSQLDPFMRMMLREVAAGAGCSYESLSRDYSQSNYSSSRLALLDDRDLWRVLQTWFVSSFREVLHKIWLQQAVLSRAIPEIRIEEYAAAPEKFEAVRFKPRGWSWIDPTKEVEAYKAAIRSGFMTVGRVIELTGDGADLEDVLKEREQELELMEEHGLKFETDPANDPKQQAPGAPAPKKDPEEVDPATEPAVQTAEKMLRERAKAL